MVHSAGFLTGFWERPGTRFSRAKVHIALHGKPYCGVKIADDKEFQWCAGYVVDRYVECERCRSKYGKHLKNVEAKRLMEKTGLDIITLYPTGLECVCSECGDIHKIKIYNGIPKIFKCPTCEIRFVTVLWKQD